MLTFAAGRRGQGRGTAQAPCAGIAAGGEVASYTGKAGAGELAASLRELQNSRGSSIAPLRCPLAGLCGAVEGHTARFKGGSWPALAGAWLPRKIRGNTRAGALAEMLPEQPAGARPGMAV